MYMGDQLPPPSVLRGHGSEVTTCSFLPAEGADAALLASGAADGQVRCGACARTALWLTLTLTLNLNLTLTLTLALTLALTLTLTLNRTGAAVERAHAPHRGDSCGGSLEVCARGSRALRRQADEVASGLEFGGCLDPSASASPRRRDPCVGRIPALLALATALTPCFEPPRGRGSRSESSRKEGNMTSRRCCLSRLGLQSWRSPRSPSTPTYRSR